MKTQVNTTREQSYNKNIYDVGWQPSHGENGEGKKKKNSWATIPMCFELDSKGDPKGPLMNLTIQH